MLDEYNLIPTTSKFVKVGDKYGRLEVLAVGKIPNTFRYKSVCKCECGVIKVVRSDSLKDGSIQSCGCYHKEKIIKHNLSTSIHYDRWKNILDRCNNPACKRYHDYGGRGIKVSQRWLNIENFIDDMGGSYYKGLEIDRIDNNGDYCKENCRWVTPKVNSRNRRSARVIKYNGMSKSLIEWAEYANITINLLWDRLNAGWEFEKALNYPVRKISRKML